MLEEYFMFSDLYSPITIDEIQLYHIAYSVKHIVDRMNFMKDILEDISDEMISKTLLEMWEENKMPETVKIPKAVEDYIDTHSFVSQGTGDVMQVAYVYSMINLYFKNKDKSEELSAEDFVKAININLDSLIAACDDTDASSVATKVMLEYTKRFINEFVKTAVVKTEDKADEKVNESSYDNVRPENLEATAPLMTSDDYKNRFKAEYYQLKIRRDKLQAMVEKWDSGDLDFTPDCPRSTYNLQLGAMNDYLAVLETRAVIEDILL